MPKKSLYIFLTGLLGVLLFLILHRVATFFFVYLLAGGYILAAVDYYQFLAIEYFTLTLSLMFGMWYGIWLGLYWYEKVYEQKARGGFVDALAQKIFPLRKLEKLPAVMQAIERRLSADVERLEDIEDAGSAPKPGSLAPQTNFEAGQFAESAARPIKRKTARKRAPAKKIKSE